MIAGDWLAKYLISKGATDAFGIPGVVVMDLLYSFENNKPDIVPHLSYHEQAAAFAASGYAQAGGSIGVAYATRGPGVTNMITAIADAYYDSTPCMFFSAHSTLEISNSMRVLNNQEIDTVALVNPITKKATRIDKIDDFKKEITEAYELAIEGRKGPVFIDIYSPILKMEIDDSVPCTKKVFQQDDVKENAVADILSEIKKAKRPIILIGNGMRYSRLELLQRIATRNSIPILSSRSSQDLVANLDLYFGFVGSRATRYSNFILEKSDLIVSFGNRLAFPVNSKSFRPVVENKNIIRIDVDEAEMKRDVPNCKAYCVDANEVLDALSDIDLSYVNSGDWVSVCKKLRKELEEWDLSPVVKSVMDMISLYDESCTVVCDVGNHSFWVTTALAYLRRRNRVLYSASFGTLGSALPKAIGAYYATKKPVLCFAGDQGIQMNIQELQYIAMHNLPIKIVIMNNQSSGMIMEREIAKYGEHLVHTTLDSGYGYPLFEKIAASYGIEYFAVDVSKMDTIKSGRESCIIEMKIPIDTNLYPYLPIGNMCQNLAPELPKELFKKLESL